MSNIAKLNVQLTATSNQFDAKMSGAGKTLASVRAGFDRATNAASAYQGMTSSIGALKLAGADTLRSFRTTMGVARSELQKFGRNKDVQVALEIGREHLSKAWLKARPSLQRVVNASGLKVAASVVADKTQNARGWLERQRRHLTKPIAVRMQLARRGIENQITSVRSKLDGLKQYRAVRISLAAVNATKLPVQAAMTTIGPLTKLAARGVSVGLHATHFGVAVGVNKARALFGGLLSFGTSVASSIGGAFMSIAKGAAGILAMAGGAAVAGIGGLATYAIKLAADAEQARVSFTTMLGSAEKARQLQSEINQFAAATPFQTTELIEASKGLLAFGVAQEQIIPTMRTLGDISAGLNIPLGELSELYGKARVQGRLFSQDINQLTGRGIPVIQEFAKQFGVTEAEVRGLVESGQINFSHLQKALASLTGEGGKFAGLMAAQSQTVSGLFSTLKDTITLNLTRVGETITDKLDLRGVIGGISESLSALATTAMPLMDGFIGGMTEGGNAGKRAGALVLTGAEMIATGIAYALNTVDLLAAGWRAAQAGVAYAIGGMLKGIDWMGAGIVKLLNYLPGVELQWTDTIGAMSDALIDEGNKLAEKAGESWDSFADGSRVKSVGRFFDQVRANANAAATATQEVGKAAEQTALKIEEAAAGQSAAVLEAMKKLKEQTAEAGLNEQQKKFAELKIAGATPEQLAQAQGLIDVQRSISKLSDIDTGDPLTDFAARMEKLQQLYAQGKVTADQFSAIRDNAKETLNEKLTDQAKSITEGVKNPLEKYQEELVRLNLLLEQGLINQQTFDRATAKARQTFDNSSGAAPDVIRANTAEAAKFAYDANRGTQKLGRDEIAKKAYVEAQEQTRLLEQVARNTRAETTPTETVDI
ncbi:MAG TPA: tape measure protein [Tepidisphaeraceae bacterium]|nr:tape measure protein [Tepidisphaeraceae bacterium]